MALPELRRQLENPNMHHILRRPEFISIWSGGKNLSGQVLLVPGRKQVGVLRVSREDIIEGGTFLLPTKLRINAIGSRDMTVQERTIKKDEHLTNLFARYDPEGVLITADIKKDIEVRFSLYDPRGDYFALNVPGRGLITVERSKIEGLLPFYKF